MLWTPSEMALEFNTSKLQAVANVSLHHHLAGTPVDVQSDNTTTMPYKSHQGGTRSLRILREKWLDWRIGQKNMWRTWWQYMFQQDRPYDRNIFSI